MAAITWKNVNGPALPDPTQAMYYAQRANDSAFTKLGTMLDEAQTQNQTVIDRGREANVNEALGALHGIGSSTQFYEMQKSGAIKAIMDSVADPRDKAALMQAPEARFKALLQSEDFNYQQAQNAQIRADQPGLDKALAFALSGQTDMAKQDAEFLSPRAQVAALTGINAIDLANRNAVNATEDRKHQAAIRPLDIQIKQNTLENGQLTRSRIEHELRLADKVSTRLDEDRLIAQNTVKLNSQKALLKETPYGEGIWNANRAEELMKLMVSAGIGDDNGERQAIIQRFNEKPTITLGEGKNARTIPVPFSAVKAAVLGSKDEWFNAWNKGYANTAEENLKAAMGLTSKVKGSDGKMYDQSDMVRDYEAYAQSQINSLGLPPTNNGPAPKETLPKVLKPWSSK